MPRPSDAPPGGTVFGRRVRKGRQHIVGGDEPEAVAEGTFKRSDAREGRAPLGQPRVEALHLMTRPGEDDLSSSVLLGRLLHLLIETVAEQQVELLENQYWPSSGSRRRAYSVWRACAFVRASTAGDRGSRAHRSTSK